VESTTVPLFIFLRAERKREILQVVEEGKINNPQNDTA
jgi:hypothetical protein